MRPGAARRTGKNVLRSHLLALSGRRLRATDVLQDVALLPARRELRQADEHVLAKVFKQQRFEMATLDDLDPAVAGSEVPAGLAYPGRGDEDALGRVLVFHHSGECVDGFKPDDLAVALGLYDAKP